MRVTKITVPIFLVGFPLRFHNLHSCNAFTAVTATSIATTPSNSLFLVSSYRPHSFPNNPLIYLRHTMASSSTSSTDYADRKSTFGFADKETLVEQLQKADTVVLDVREAEEIKEHGTFQPPGLAYYSIPCTREDVVSLVQERAPSILPTDLDTPIIVYCQAGRRAAKAKQTLTEMGYTHVLNAGGYSDIQDMKLEEHVGK
jgi:phage shock protein E